MVGRNREEIVFLLWENNMLGDYITWSLFISQKKYYLRRIIWKQRSPYKLETPEIYCQERQLPNKILNDIIGEFLSFDLASLEKINKEQKYLVIDSVEYGICLRDKRISWHHSSNKMAELVKWHTASLAQFKKWLI